MATPRLSTDNLCLLTNNLSHLNKFSNNFPPRHSCEGRSLAASLNKRMPVCTGMTACNRGEGS